MANLNSKKRKKYALLKKKKLVGSTTQMNERHIRTVKALSVQIASDIKSTKMNLFFCSSRPVQHERGLLSSRGEKKMIGGVMIDGIRLSWCGVAKENEN